MSQAEETAREMNERSKELQEITVPAEPYHKNCSSRSGPPAILHLFHNFRSTDWKSRMRSHHREDQPQGTHGSQILRLLDMGVDKWPEIKNDMVKIKADSTNLVRDVTSIKKEVPS